MNVADILYIHHDGQITGLALSLRKLLLGLDQTRFSPTVLLAQEGSVFTFEPVPDSAKWLRRHLELNQIEKTVRVIESACGNKFGFVSMPTWPLDLAAGNGLFDVHPQADISPNYVDVCIVPLNVALDFKDGSWVIQQKMSLS